MKHEKFKDPIPDQLKIQPDKAIKILQNTPAEYSTLPALNMGIVSIKRLLIPQKVYKYGSRIKCPTCNRRLRTNQRDPHCPRCGQLLDWDHLIDLEV